MKKVDKSSSAGTADEQRTEADNSTSASLLPNPMLGDASSDLWSLHEKTMAETYRKIWSDFDKHLRMCITKNLKELGYEFISESDFILFVKKRIFRISFEDKPNYFEIYLDFIDYDNKGTFIGSYSDRVHFVWDENTVRATISRSIA